MKFMIPPISIPDFITVKVLSENLFIETINEMKRLTETNTEKHQKISNKIAQIFLFEFFVGGQMQVKNTVNLVNLIAALGVTLNLSEHDCFIIMTEFNSTLCCQTKQLV